MTYSYVSSGRFERYLRYLSISSTPSSEPYTLKTLRSESDRSAVEYAAKDIVRQTHQHALTHILQPWLRLRSGLPCTIPVWMGIFPCIFNDTVCCILVQYCEVARHMYKYAHEIILCKLMHQRRIRRILYPASRIKINAFVAFSLSCGAKVIV